MRGRSPSRWCCVVQALLFADGGLTALGLNVLNMALVTAFGGYAIFRGIRGVLPTTRGRSWPPPAIAAVLSVVLASLAFVVEYAIGGNGGASITDGVHRDGGHARPDRHR